MRKSEAWRLSNTPPPQAGISPRARRPFAAPGVADGRVFVADYDSTGDKTPNPGKRSKLTGKERVLCFDARTGKEQWKQEYDCDYDVSYPAGPRCTPTVSGGKVYTLGAM